MKMTRTDSYFTKIYSMFHPMFNFKQKSFGNTKIPSQLDIQDNSKPRSSSCTIIVGQACKNISVCTLTVVKHVNTQKPIIKFYVTHFILTEYPPNPGNMFHSTSSLTYLNLADSTQY